jgi:hypothetical protein
MIWRSLKLITQARPCTRTVYPYVVWGAWIWERCACDAEPLTDGIYTEVEDDGRLRCHISSTSTSIFKGDEFLRVYTTFTRLRMQTVGVDGSNMFLDIVDSRGLERST